MRDSLPGTRILELGSGTSLPGILAAKCGAKVFLSDLNLPNTLGHIERCCTFNNLKPGENIEVIGLTWGILGNPYFHHFSQDNLDFIIGSDIFYDPTVFEDILVTVAFLLDQSPSTKFIFAYQERSSDWSLQPLLKKWDLNCVYIDYEPIERTLGIDLKDFMQNHEIYLLEVTKK
jgi:predicted nicotinamide N-methyase